MSSRRKLFEILNQVKTDLEENNDRASVVSSSSSVNGIQSLPRGAGRAKLFKPQLSNNAITNQSNGQSSKNEESSNQRISSPDHSSSSNASQISDLKDIKLGTAGITIPLAVNYIPIKCKPNTSMFEYDVSFEPNIHSNMLRCGLVASVLKTVTVFTFDGTTLYLPVELPNESTKFVGHNRFDNLPVEIVVKFRRISAMKDCIHFYNVLFKQVMRKLEYVQFGQKMFDPSKPKIIPHRQLTIWPGYALACDEYDGGLKLIMDTSHRVLFNTHVSDLLRRIRMSCEQHPGQNFKDAVEKSLLGAVVRTTYSNRSNRQNTYTISDIDFKQTPMSTFKTKTDDISYIDYYKTNYNEIIHDVNQPLLIAYKPRKMMASNGRCQEDRLTIALVPELCKLTGLTDEMRNDKAMMRDIASFTRVTPNQCVDSIRTFIGRVNQTPSARELLDNWGLQLDSDVQHLQGRQLPEQDISFANKTISNVCGDFQIGNDVLFEVIDLNNWILFYTRQDLNAKKEFLSNLQKCAKTMGLTWQQPIEYQLKDDRNDTYANTLRELLTPEIQMACFICPTSRDDRYSIIKKICCSDNPVASQVINSRTLANTQKNRSIVQKILMQMNCKLGGSLWSIRIPFKNGVMICGTDTYHSPNKGQSSVAAFVASLNKTFTKWYSKATIQSNHEELLHGLAVSTENALKAFKKLNGQYPARIIMYRDGVGDGQFNLCKEFEIPQMKSACRLVDENYNPDITFIVVQKRVNTRIFKVDRERRFDNAPPGTVVDHSITRRGLFDFYLVSQKMRHGTVTPSHYVVIENENKGLSADILQQLSYKLTYQYFNWPGAIRVPAPCQYAHKLAYLVGESIKRETAEELNDKLFYL